RSLLPCKSSTSTRGHVRTSPSAPFTMAAPSRVVGWQGVGCWGAPGRPARPVRSLSFALGAPFARLPGATVEYRCCVLLLGSCYSRSAGLWASSSAHCSALDRAHVIGGRGPTGDGDDRVSEGDPTAGMR